ncbi:MAG: hypothetical protein WDM89_17695 [Rhizomicrobium sp.]
MSDNLEYSELASTFGVRDTTRKIVKQIAVTFSRDNVIVAVEENAGRECMEDRLIVFAESRTGIIALRYSPLICWVGATPHFVGGEYAAQRVSEAVASAVRATLRRWAE